MAYTTNIKELQTDIQKILVLEIILDTPYSKPLILNDFNFKNLSYGVSVILDTTTESSGVSPISLNQSDFLNGTTLNMRRSANTVIQLCNNTDFLISGSVGGSGCLIPLFLTFSDNKHFFTYYAVTQTYINSYCILENATNTNYGFLTSNGTDSSITLVASFSTGATSEAKQEELYQMARDYVESTDPYDGAGDSDTGGGDGTFDGSSDPVPIPSLPTVGATDAGFITLFAPTSAQLHALASYCWSNLFDIDTFKKLFNDPMDCILGLSVVPVSVPTSGAREITVGNIVTTVQMNVASQQYIEVDCGSISFANKYFGSYLDYEPYTKMAIFLPYCGTHQISADDVMGKIITVKYHIDILTGSCIAFVKCGDSVLYEFNGACASNIPVNSLNYSSTIENAIRIAVNIGTTVATAGASAPLSTATEGASALATAQNIGRGISLAGSTAEGALSMKPSVSRSGAMGGGVGLLGNQTPYIIITRPRLCKPKNQDHFEGYPSFIYSKIEDLIGQGFTSFTDVIISEQFLTDEEENELEAILKGGVYL